MSDTIDMPTKSERMTFRVTRALRDAINKAAKEDQRKPGDWINVTLTNLLAQRQSKEQAA